MKAFFSLTLALALHWASADHGGHGRDWGRNDGGPCQKVALNVRPSAQLEAGKAMNITCTFSRMIPKFLFLLQSDGVNVQTLAEVNPFLAVVLMLEPLVPRVSVLIDYMQLTITFIYSSAQPSDSGKFQCFGPLNEMSNQVDVTVGARPSPSSSSTSTRPTTRSTVKATVANSTPTALKYSTKAPLPSNATAFNISSVHSCVQQVLQVATIVAPPLCAILAIALALIAVRYAYRCRPASPASASSPIAFIKEKEAQAQAQAQAEAEPEVAKGKLKLFKGSKYMLFENEIDSGNPNPIDCPPPYNLVVQPDAQQLPPSYDVTRGVV